MCDDVPAKVESTAASYKVLGEKFKILWISEIGLSVGGGVAI